MKMLSKDIRYIIKRILIGVGIAVLLFNLKQCNVYALEKNIYMNLTYSGSGSDPYFYRYGNYNGYYSSALDFEFVSSNLTKWNFQTYLQTYITSPYYYIVYYNSNLNVYYYDIITFRKAYVNVDNINVVSLNIDFDNNRGIYLYSFVNSTDINDNSFNNAFKHNSFFLSDSNVINDLDIYCDSISSYSPTSVDISNGYDFYTYYSSNSGGALVNINNSSFWNDFEILDTNISNIYLDNNIIYGNGNFNAQVDLIENQAVYFVPKNYQTIEKTSIDNIDFINFPFQYKGSLKHGFFNIFNTNQLVFNYSPQSVLSSSDYTSYDIDFPLYYDNNSQDLNSIIFFNQNQVNSSIKFDSTLFDYYIIDDMSNYKNDIDIIDTSGNSQSLSINFYKTIDEMWQEGLTVDSDYWLAGFKNNDYQNNLDAYFDLFTIPFEWLRGLSRDRCTSISLPLPFVNSSITLDCLSSKFKSVLGNNFYNIMFYIITGLLAYRITIHNIDTLTDVLNPSDDKLEVVEL